MISQAEEPHYAAVHGRGGYLARKWVHQSYPHPPGANVWYLTRDPVEATRFASVEQGIEWLADLEMSGFILRLAPVCACCGDDFVVRHPSGHFSPYRCEKHAQRNPCAIEGCKRTTEARGDPLRLRNNDHLCGEHWKRFVPPGSSVRRAYHRFWRIAKKQRTPQNPEGWTVALARRFDRFWRGLIKMARRKASEPDEFLDEAEIKKMFGWD